jgi:hypothetical protein
MSAGATSAGRQSSNAAYQLARELHRNWCTEALLLFPRMFLQQLRDGIAGFPPVFTERR